MSTSEILFEEYMIGRARIYGELAMLASKPLRLDRVRFFCESMTLFLEAVEDETDKEKLKFSIAEMDAWLKENDGREDEQEFRNERAREFTYLFRFGDDRITDNASAALSKKKLMKRKEWEDCKRFYREHGFKLCENVKKLEDSFEVQALFMEHLINMTLFTEEEMVDELLRAQVTFLDDHILKWINVLSAGLSSFAKEGSIYRAIAPLFTVICKTDCECIKELV
ncbi:molecular chaperone [Deferribacteres bacterium DY0037]